MFKFWKKKRGIPIVLCAECNLFIETGCPFYGYGEIKKDGKVLYDYCERCQAKKRGFVGARTKSELGLG